MRSHRSNRYGISITLITVLLMITLLPGHNAARLSAAPAFLSPGQSYTTPDGAFTLNYPDGWLVKNPDGDTFIFTSDQKAMGQMTGSGSPTLNAGQIGVQLQYASGDVKLPPGADVSSGAQGYLSSMMKLLPHAYTLGKVQPVSLGNLDAASLTFSDKGFDGVIYAFFEGKVPFLSAVATAPGEIATGQFITEEMILSIRPAQASVATMQPTLAATSAALNLEQTGTTADKSYTFNYPAGWVIQSAGSDAVIVGTSQSAVTSTGNMKSGQVIIQIRDYPKGGANPPGAKFDAGPVVMLKSLITSNTPYTYSDVKAYQLGQIEAARVDVTSTGIAGVAYTFFVGDMPFLVSAATTPDETAANIPLFEAVAQSIKPVGQPAAPTESATQSATESAIQSASNGTGIDLSQTFKFPDFVVQLNYPAGWVAKKVSGYVIVANSDASMAAATSSNPQLSAGGVAILIEENLFRAGNLTDGDLTAILKSIMPSKPPMLVSPPASYQIGGTIDAIRIIARGPQLDAVGYAYKWNKTSSFIIVAGTAPGELFTDMPTIEAIIKSIGAIK